jgi:hypothetical protein
MIILLTAFLAGASPLPQIDRTALDLQARAEALQPRARTQARTVQRRTPAPARTQPARPRIVAAATPSRSNKASTPPARGPVRVAAAPVRAPVRANARRTATTVRRVSGGSPLDLAQITTICRAAGNQDDPAGFLARLSSAYSLSADDSVSLRASCAAYLAGRADARRASGGTY